MTNISDSSKIVVALKVRKLTIEEHLLSCGFGSLFLETANYLKLDSINITRIGVEHTLVANDSCEALLRDFGLTGEIISTRG